MRSWNSWGIWVYLCILLMGITCLLHLLGGTIKKWQFWLCAVFPVCWVITAHLCMGLAALLWVCSCHLPPSAGYARENNHPSPCCSVSLRSLFHCVGNGSFPTWQPRRNKRAPLSSFPMLSYCPSASDCSLTALPPLPSFRGGCSSP